MIVETGFRVPHPDLNIGDLTTDILTVLLCVEALFVLHIERKGHIDAVEPDLVRVDQLMPEVPLRGPWHGAELRAYELEGLPVLLFSGEVIQRNKILGRVHIIERVLRRIIGTDAAIFLDEAAHEAVREVEETGLAGDLIALENAGDHAAVDIVPLVALPASDHLEIPGRMLGIRVVHEIVDVLIEKLFGR